MPSFVLICGEDLLFNILFILALREYEGTTFALCCKLNINDCKKVNDAFEYVIKCYFLN